AETIRSPDPGGARLPADGGAGSSGSSPPAVGDRLGAVRPDGVAGESTAPRLCSSPPAGSPPPPTAGSARASRWSVPAPAPHSRAAAGRPGTSVAPTSDTPPPRTGR